MAGPGRWPVEDYIVQRVVLRIGAGNQQCDGLLNCKVVPRRDSLLRRTGSRKKLVLSRTYYFFEF